MSTNFLFHHCSVNTFNGTDVVCGGCFNIRHDGGMEFCIAWCFLAELRFTICLSHTRYHTRYIFHDRRTLVVHIPWRCSVCYWYIFSLINFLTFTYAGPLYSSFQIPRSLLLCIHSVHSLLPTILQEIITTRRSSCCSPNPLTHPTQPSSFTPNKLTLISHMRSPSAHSTPSFHTRHKQHRYLILYDVR